MILNRLATALKRQDWLVVVIEIAVVVLGIFIGLQVDDWNESRKQRAEEALYIEQIIVDLETMRTDIVDEIERRQQRIAAMARALAALETCSDSEQATADLELAFGFYQVANAINVLDATFDEMRRSGALARIADPVLKQQLVYAFAGLSRTGPAMTGFRASIPVVDAIVWDNVTFTLRERADGQLRQSARFDFAELCDSRPMRNAIIEMLDIQQDGYGHYFTTLQQIDPLLERLQDYAARRR